MSLLERKSKDIDREARERGRFLNRTTDLSKRQALCIAYSELGFSYSGIAKRIDATPGTVKKYIRRTAAQYGHRAIEPKLADERGETRVEEVTREQVMALPSGTREWWSEAAKDNPDVAPAWALDESVLRNGRTA